MTIGQEKPGVSLAKTKPPAEWQAGRIYIHCYGDKEKARPVFRIRA
jgi:hypothetical protein